MKILLTGAHGFIGSRLLAALLDAGHELVCPVRAVTARDLGMRGARFVPADFRRMDRSADWAPLLDGMQAAINTVGVFRDSADNGYAAVHGAAPVALFNAARQRGVRVIHFSALGADAGAASEFHRSKRAADDALRALDMPAHIVQPSLVYGPGGASAALFDRLALWPLLPLPGGGRQQIQPVHVQDVVAGVSALLASPPDRVVTIAFCGPQALSLRDYLAALRRGLGVDARQRVIALPGGLARAAARIGRHLPGSLFNPESLSMLERGNTADPSAFSAALGRAPRPPQDFVDADLRQALWSRAALDNMLPLLRLSLAAVWLWTAAVSIFGYPVRDSLALLERAGVPAALAPAALYGAAALDLVLGLLTLAWRRVDAVLLWRAQIGLILAYTAIISWRLPEQWLHPFGPISKNLPMLAVLALLALAARSKARR